MEYSPSLSLVVVRLSSTKRTVVCATGPPPGSVTRPDRVRGSDSETAAAVGGGDIETEEHGPAREGRGGEEVTHRAVRGVDARAALAGVGLDVRGGMRASDVEAGVGPRGGPRQQELGQGAGQPEGTRPGGAPDHAGDAGGRPRFRTTTAPTSTTPYMHTISGPVGKSPASDSHSPRIEASAPEPQEMYVRRRISRVKRNAITAGTTKKLKTISTPATGTASVITTPNDR